MDMNDLNTRPELAAIEAKLGTRQRDILRSLRDHKSWHDSQRPSWVWSTLGITRKAMQALVRVGLARVEEGAGEFMGSPVDVYYPI